MSNSTIGLSEVLSIGSLSDLSTINLDAKGQKIDRQSTWAVFTRTVKWVVTGGLAERNPELNDITRNVISIVKEALQVPESLSKNDYKTALKALENLKQIQAANRGNQIKELDKVIQVAKEHGPWIEAVDSGIQTGTELRNLWLGELISSDKQTIIYRYTKFKEVNGVRQSTIDIDKIRQDIAAFYPGVRLYRGNVEGSPASKDANDERLRTENAMLLVILVKMGTTEAKEYIRQNQPGAKIDEGFDFLFDYLNKNYQTGEELHALFTTLEIHDLGKVEYITKLATGNFASAEAASESHDQTLLRFLESPYRFLLRTLVGLEEQFQKIIKNVWESECSTPQFMQGENLPGNLLEVIKLCKTNPKAYQLLKDHDLFDLAGSVPAKPGLPLNEPTIQAWLYATQGIEEAAANLKDPDDEIELRVLALAAYNSYLSKRAGVLDQNIKDDIKLNLKPANSPEDFAIMRICCMNRTFDHATARLIQEAFDDLKKADQKTYDLLIAEMNKEGFDSKDPAILVYYAPNLIQNYLNLAKFKKKEMQTENGQPVEKVVDRSSEEKRSMVVQGLRTLASVYQIERRHIDQELKSVLADKLPSVRTVYVKGLVDTLSTLSFEAALKLNKFVFNSRSHRVTFAIPSSGWSGAITSIFWRLLGR